MRFVGLVFLLALSSLSVRAQNVGVDEENPQGKVHIKSNSSISIPQLRLTESESDFTRIKLENTLFPAFWDIAGFASDNAESSKLVFNFNNGTSIGDRLTINGLGRIGINIPSPQAKLDILGGDWNLDSGVPGDLRIGNSTHNLRIGVATGGGGAGIARIYAGKDLRLGINNKTIINIREDERVGIKTNFPGADLDVNGDVRIRSLAGVGDRNLMVDSEGDIILGGSSADTDWTETVDLVKTSRSVEVVSQSTSRSGLAVYGRESNGVQSALSVWNFMTFDGEFIPTARLLFDANDIDAFNGSASSPAGIPLYIHRQSQGDVLIAQGGGNIGIKTNATDSYLTIPSIDNQGSRASIRIGTSSPMLLDNDELDVTGGSTGLRINANSNKPVAIGTHNFASGYKLSVEGKIIADEIRVQVPTAWPDYVFSDDYTLPTLHNLKKSIENNGHLPGIPDAKTMEEEGIAVAAMQVKLMEKIEELTLYILQLDAKNKELEKRLIDLEENN